jgi:hypothetical protein
LEEKDVEISKLRAEVDKLQSVLQIKVHKDAGKPDILATIQEDAITSTCSPSITIFVELAPFPILFPDGAT